MVNEPWILSQFEGNVLNPDSRVIFNYIGFFSQELIFRIAEESELKLKTEFKNSKRNSDIYSMLIEGLQNIRNHGKSNLNGDKIGLVYLIENKGTLQLHFGNIIRSNEKENIQLLIDKVNNFSSNEIRDLYNQSLEKRILNGEFGSGLGFMILKIKSKSDLKCFFVDNPNGNTFFSYSIEF